MYYGDTLYEIDSDTGKLLSTIPKDNIVWISGNIVLKAIPSSQLSAFDKQTGKLLWDKDHLFPIDEGLTPQYAGGDVLIIPYGYSSSFIKGICALNLRTGESNWCRPEAFESMMTIDRQAQHGFAMRSDSVLLTIDLQTGSVLGETSFLSSEPKQEQPGLTTITTGDGIVTVSFGDSLQAFGLKFSHN